MTHTNNTAADHRQLSASKSRRSNVPRYQLGSIIKHYRWVGSRNVFFFRNRTQHVNAIFFFAYSGPVSSRRRDTGGGGGGVTCRQRRRRCRFPHRSDFSFFSSNTIARVPCYRPGFSNYYWITQQQRRTSLRQPKRPRTETRSADDSFATPKVRTGLKITERTNRADRGPRLRVDTERFSAIARKFGKEASTVEPGQCVQQSPDRDVTIPRTGVTAIPRAERNSSNYLVCRPTSGFFIKLQI